MLGMFYERKCTTEEVATLITLRRQHGRSPSSTFKFSNVELKTSKGMMALARWIRFVQKLEDKYAFHPDDKLAEVFGDNMIKFHLNNIDGWHP